MSTWNVPKLWDGGECWIIGGGLSMPRQFGVPEDVIERVCQGKLNPSVYSPYLEPLHDKHVIGINNAYQIGTWIDIVFFGDGSWHLAHRRMFAKWPGIKVTCSPKFKGGNKEGIKYLRKEKIPVKEENKKRLRFMEGISENPHMVGWNANSGAAAISLAYHLGVKRIYLLGFDMSMEGKFSHWHGRHAKSGGKIPPFKRHLKGFPAIARDAKKLGLEIVNVNKDSRIDAFPKVELREVLCA